MTLDESRNNRSSEAKRPLYRSHGRRVSMQQDIFNEVCSRRHFDHSDKFHLSEVMLYRYPGATRGQVNQLITRAMRMIEDEQNASV